MKSKLLNELPELLEHNIISNDVANTITAYYQSKESEEPNRLFTIFGVLGSALVGLGIILILAHNWDNFSKSIKTFFAFLPLIIGQLACGLVDNPRLSKLDLSLPLSQGQNDFAIEYSEQQAWEEVNYNEPRYAAKG